MPAVDYDWMDDAACLTAEDPEIFFPALQTEERTEENDARHKQAKRMCEKDCSVRQECLLDALESEADGIRAGFTTRERKALIKQWLIDHRGTRKPGKVQAWADRHNIRAPQD